MQRKCHYRTGELSDKFGRESEILAPKFECGRLKGNGDVDRYRKRPVSGKEAVGAGEVLRVQTVLQAKQNKDPQPELQG
jgi:hypothetical protein